MELSTHMDHLEVRFEELQAARQDMAEATQNHRRNIVGFLHPDVLKAELIGVKTIGRCVVDLVRLTPHASEIHQIIKQRRESGES